MIAPLLQPASLVEGPITPSLLSTSTMPVAANKYGPAEFWAARLLSAGVQFGGVRSRLAAAALCYPDQAGTTRTQVIEDQETSSAKAYSHIVAEMRHGGDIDCDHLICVPRARCGAQPQLKYW